MFDLFHSVRTTTPLIIQETWEWAASLNCNLRYHHGPACFSKRPGDAGKFWWFG